MPRGDGTGPAGMGPMTGRAAGYCAGYSVPGYMNPIPGRGWGFGRGWGRGRSWGRGRGWGRGAYPYGAGYYGAPYAGGYYGEPYANPYAGSDYGAPYANPYNPQMTPQQESDMLKEQAKAMQEELKAVNERISELQSTAKKAK